MTGPVRGVLLDFDGVISGNATGLLFGATHAFIDRRAPMPEECLLPLFKQITAFPMREALTMMLSGIGMGDEFPALAAELGGLREFGGRSPELSEGFTEFLGGCAEREIPVLVCSTMDRDTVRRALLDPYFTADDFLPLRSRSKAAPATYVDALAEVGVDEVEGWTLVDDSPFALRAAKLAGLRTVMVTNEVFTEEDARPHRRFVDECAGSLPEVAALLGIADGGPHE
ncbi:beta-phosphoglucomutase-like phosphatase (HAD superfamily) [Saccharopolyspora lacisalsi]|uniref:Beta-phosphoglucomutase-like phosphatase (HAD superfamily) n=1 Tax=Halosaccharopolyspora lacisalsi TaxID=1000566 RepID=A0A839E5R3_9PSEU|nr:HAD family hydrolase [Halosaccharopolyspora lacisalsi]MBA8826228.1 beta-phosphoglucomutase-like phosphatase (HAD superfamily) [Halosaccharopolyspora lacisalsi]